MGYWNEAGDLIDEREREGVSENMSDTTLQLSYASAQVVSWMAVIPVTLVFYC